MLLTQKKREKHEARHTNGEIEVNPWWVDAGFKCTGSLSVRWQIAKCVRSGGGVAVRRDAGNHSSPDPLTSPCQWTLLFCAILRLDRWEYGSTLSVLFDEIWFDVSSGCLLLLRAFGWCSLLLQFILWYDLLLVACCYGFFTGRQNYWCPIQKYWIICCNRGIIFIMSGFIFSSCVIMYSSSD